MVIYGEYLFLENFIAGVLLLLVTAKISGQSPTGRRLAAGGVICGIAGFSIFINLGSPGGIAFRFFVAGVAVLIGLGAKNLKDFMKKTLAFLAFTFLSGGLIMGLLLWFQRPALYGNGAIYMEALTYTKLILWGILAFGICFWFARFIRGRKIEEFSTGEVTIVLNGQSHTLKAFIDSGNHLREPISGKPVILLDNKGQLMLGSGNAETYKSFYIPEDKYVAVPYRTVGTENGILKAFRSDSVAYGDKEMKGTVVALYQGDFGEYEVLLGKDFLSGDDNGRRKIS